MFRPQTIMEINHSTTIPSCNHFEGKILQRGELFGSQSKGYQLLLWKSLLAAQDVLKLGIRWRVGNGEKIKIWGNKWLPIPSSFRVQSPPKILSENATVKELLTVNGGWNPSLISEIYWEDKGKNILNIPLGKTMQEDKLLWAHIENGKFTVKSVYFITLQSKMDSKGSSSQILNRKWKKLLGLSVPENVKNFLRWAHNNSLPTKDSLHYRKITSDPLCPICKQEAETVIYLVWDNYSAKNDVWDN